MKIESEFKNEEMIPVKYTADGENVNPGLIISNIPSNAKSLILVVEDPDAVKVVGHSWLHWIVFNIPVKFPQTIIEENSLPGIPGESTYKKKEYGGPNPPKGNGVHNYHFRIYAVDKMLDLPEMPSLNQIIKSAEKNILEITELIGTYERK